MADTTPVGHSEIIQHLIDYHFEQMQMSGMREGMVHHALEGLKWVHILAKWDAQEGLDWLKEYCDQEATLEGVEG